MKNRIRSFSRIILICTSLIFSYGQLFGQGKVNVSAGIGMPEAINLGFRYQINQSQVGGSAGWWPGDPDAFLFNFSNVFSFSGDYYYHFAGTSKYSDLKPWYVRPGLNCLLIDFDPEIDTIVDIYLRIGRDIYLTDKGGFSLDGGVLFFPFDSGDGFRSVIPALGTRLFYRF